MSTVSKSATQEWVRIALAGSINDLQQPQLGGGSPSPRDLSRVTPRELKNNGRHATRAEYDYILSVCQSMGGPVSSSELLEKAQRRANCAIGAVAGPKGTRDGAFLAEGEIEKVKDPILRKFVQLCYRMVRWY